MSEAQTTPATNAADKKKQPKGLYMLFGAEAWERFCYYGMRAILVLYLCAATTASDGQAGLGFTRDQALALYATYCGLVYLTPMLGGFLADRVLGARKAIIIGGITMAIGEMCMASPALLYLAMALLILGNGFFKPNISNIVGGLYEKNDPRLDGGFTIFYMGINVGSFFAPLVCGTLGTMYGYKYGFIAAGIGMIIGQIIFNMGFKHYGVAGYPPDMVDVKPGTPLRKRDWFDIMMYVIGVVIIAAIAIFGTQSLLPDRPNVSLFMAAVLMLLSTVAIHYATKEKMAPFLAQKADQDKESQESASETDHGEVKMYMGFSVEEWQRIAAIVVMSCFVIFFWMGFEQAGGTMTLFAEQKTDRVLGGFTIPAAWFQSINPFVICAFAPLFSMMWYAWDNSKYKISTPYKMAMGLFFLSLGFIIMYFADGLVVVDEAGNVVQGVSPLWLTAVYFLHTFGELCLSPVGLSMITKLSPQRIMSIMMGFWFLVCAVSDYTAGYLESLLTFFGLNLWHFLIFSSAGAGVLLVCMGPLLKKWMHGRA